MHSQLFADTMSAMGLDPGAGPPVDRLPGTTLATTNLISMFGLHRRLRGALVGHLAGFEMTSCVPNRRYGDGMRRLGYDDRATRFFDEHVEADAAHEAIAAHDLAGALVRDDPALLEDVLFGAAALLVTERRASETMLSAWSEGRSSLLEHRRDRARLSGEPERAVRRRLDRRDATAPSGAAGWVRAGERAARGGSAAGRAATGRGRAHPPRAARSRSIGPKR